MLTPQHLPTLTTEIDGCVLGHWRGIQVGVWARSTTVELVAEQDRLMQLMAASSRKFSVVQLVVKAAPLPTGDVRAAYEGFMRRYGDSITCAALYLEGSGFWASAVRAFLMGLALVAPRTRIKAFTSLIPLTEWIARMHSSEAEAVSAEELHCALSWMLERPEVRKHREVSS